MHTMHNDWLNAFPDTPDSIKNMVKDTVEEQLHNKNKRKANSLLKAAAMMIACILCVSGTAAATGMWKMHSEKEKSFALKTIIEGTDIDGQKSTEEKMYTYELSYIPEYLELGYCTLIYKDHSKQGASLWFINANDVTELVDTYVVDYETTTIGEHPVTIVYRNVSGEGIDRTLYYVLFEAEEILLEFSNIGIPKEDMIKIIEGLSLTETTDAEAENLVVESTWAFQHKTPEYVYNPPEVSADQEYDFTIYSCNREDMKNLHSVGEQFMVTGLLDATVTNVIVSDSIEILNPDAEYLTYYPTAPDFDENGMLKDRIEQTIDYGDGINTLTNVTEEDIIPMTMVLIEVEYTNRTEWVLEPRQVYSHLVAAYENDDTYQLKESAVNTIYYWAMDYYNGTKYDLEKNYELPELEVGESCTVYWVYKVPEEDLPYLYVGLNKHTDNFGKDGLDPETLEIGLVDIRQK